MNLFSDFGFTVGKRITWYWRHLIRHATKNGQSHGTLSRPLEGDPDPYPYLRELTANARRETQEVAERYAQSEQRLRANALTARWGLLRAREARTRASARHRTANGRFKLRHGEDAPLTGGTGWISYVARLGVLTILETWINSQVFSGVLGAVYGPDGYGDFELWGFSLALALLLVWLGHYIGYKLKNAVVWTTLNRAVTGLAISGLVVVLVGSLFLRAADPAISIWMAIGFSSLNFGFAALGTFMSYVCHLEGRSDVVETRRVREKARNHEAQSDDAFRKARAVHEGNWNAKRAKALGIAETYQTRINAFKDVLLKSWEKGKTVPESLNHDLVIPLPTVFQEFEPVADVPEAPADEASDLELEISNDSLNGNAIKNVGKIGLADLEGMTTGDGAQAPPEPTIS